MGWMDGLFGARPAGDETAPAPDVDRTLVLYKYDACPYCRLVLGRLARLDNVHVDLRDTLRDPGARRELYDLTGRTQVPCLLIDGEPLFESADIARWLERYAQRPAA